eukprot:TRINITY_DN5466_c0_g1_i2.p1 TRINITY_DN5466_c0_g1~~TRINITY_DN5466_c0_g1_i2.p1  ORF type:complete len:1067 (+),score=393.58 TRINITY_DN5466_c0_g1_i2:284-3484(+)
MLPVYVKRQLVIPFESSDDPATSTKRLLDLLVNRDDDINLVGPYAWLDSKLRTPFQDDEQRTKTMLRFRDAALRQNLHNRSGIMRRFIYLMTSNLNKLAEYTSTFTGLYGIEVLRIPCRPSTGSTLDPQDIQSLLSHGTNSLVPLAVIREESNLYRPGSDAFSSLEHGSKATNTARLWAYTLDKNTQQLNCKMYGHSVVGTLDLTRRTNSFLIGDVFGWDDIFVLPCGLSYHDLRCHNVKRSSRDLCISDFLVEKVYYAKFLDVQFNKQTPGRVIDFSKDVADFVENSRYYNNSKSVEYGIRNLQNHVLNFGVFFRAAKNRRQNNYWNPGLNGGIPLTKKKDEIHEITFMCHDFGHFGIPDLIFVGNNSVRHRRAYIAWRMISEATTMTLADMLFVDSLAKTGVEYDFSARKIYPLFLDLNVDLSEKENRIFKLKEVVRANFHYCLTGNTSYYQEMLKNAGKSDENLKKFEEKFMPFFVEDFRWTEHNYDNMQLRAEEMRRWWDSILPLRNLKYLNLKSIDDFLTDLKNVDDSDTENFIASVFEKVFDEKVKPIVENQVEILPKEVRLQRGFTRYMAGQLCICAKFHFIPQSQIYLNKIIDLLLQHEKGMSIEVVNEIRRIFDEFLELLLNEHLISKDDRLTFAEVYPLFDPLYVSYDKSHDDYEDLASVSRRIFSLDTHRQKQFGTAGKILGRSLFPTEKKYLSKMSTLVEESGGQIDDGIFVIRPGVLLLSKTVELNSQEIPKNMRGDLMATFLIAGISVETSMELIAHKEARVARLTSSKTMAMNFPLFRIQGWETWEQKRYLEGVLHQRLKFENSHAPRKSWEDGNEIWNITAPGCKSTALCYTMSLRDFHGVFIGRMGPHGNEKEVREIVRRMADILHEFYPDIILSADEYLNLKNGDKYKTAFSDPATEIPRNFTEISWIADTKATDDALRLFKLLNLGKSDEISEFRSRITYLAFPEVQVEDSTSYLKTILEEHCHMSVVAAIQVGIVFPGKIQLETREMMSKSGCVKIFDEFGILLISAKDLFQLLYQWKSLQLDVQLGKNLARLANQRFSFIKNWDQ